MATASPLPVSEVLGLAGALASASQLWFRWCQVVPSPMGAVGCTSPSPPPWPWRLPCGPAGGTRSPSSQSPWLRTRLRAEVDGETWVGGHTKPWSAVRELRTLRGAC